MKYSNRSNPIDSRHDRIARRGLEVRDQTPEVRSQRTDDSRQIAAGSRNEAQGSYWLFVISYTEKIHVETWVVLTV